jgi:transcriptional regulator with XRE-family HTH domain
MEPFNVVTHLIARGFKSQGHLAREIGKAPSTVSNYAETGNIPHPVQREIILAARRLGFTVEPDDFFEPELRAQAPAPA